MLEMRLRGYVAPEDFEGTDTQRIQKALDLSAELDIGRVVLKGNYRIDETLWIHPMTDLVLEDATLTATGAFPVLANKNLAESDKNTYSFQDKYITIRGNGKFDGDVILYNAFHVNINGLEFAGVLRFSFAREVRLYNSKFTGENGVVMNADTWESTDIREYIGYDNFIKVAPEGTIELNGNAEVTFMKKG